MRYSNINYPFFLKEEKCEYIIDDDEATLG